MIVKNSLAQNKQLRP